MSIRSTSTGRRRPSRGYAVTAPIVGISRMEQLEAKLKGFSWELTAEEWAEIGRLFPTGVWEESGGRFPDWRRSYDIVSPPKSL